jgi:hypothetical protein
MLTTKDKAQATADGLGITVWITEDDRIVQHQPSDGGTEIRPNPKSAPVPHVPPPITLTFPPTDFTGSV